MLFHLNMMSDERQISVALGLEAQRLFFYLCHNSSKGDQHVEDTLWFLRKMIDTCETRLTIWDVGKHQYLRVCVHTHVYNVHVDSTNI